MAIIHPHLAIVPLNGNGLNSPIKRDRVVEYIKKKKALWNQNAVGGWGLLFAADS